MRWDLAGKADLAQLVADERWDAIGDFIDQLPRTSHMKVAMLNDPEYAERIAEMDEPTEKWSPSATEYGLLESMVGQLISAVAGVQSAVIAAAGGKPQAHTHFPTPVTEVDRAKERLGRKAASAILEMAGFDPAEYL